jgi:hypothetical protein
MRYLAAWFSAVIWVEVLMWVLRVEYWVVTVADLTNPAVHYKEGNCMAEVKEEAVEEAKEEAEEEEEEEEEEGRENGWWPRMI